ncbi:hypothetical protein FB451DRAFT_1295325, partial [Mycena latifolia]
LLRSIPATAIDSSELSKSTTTLRLRVLRQLFMSFAAHSSCVAIALQSWRSLCSASCIAFARPSNARGMPRSRCAVVTSPGRHAFSADRSANWWRSGVARARLCPRAGEAWLGVGVREPGLLVDEGTEGACGDRIRWWHCRGSGVLRRKR